MNYQDWIIYQIYTLGFCGAPKKNDGWNVNRISKVLKWADYMHDFGINAVLFNPIWESESHGYDTTDFYTLDRRLGTNDDFKQLCRYLHQKEIKIILDSVFHHVGRNFPPFLDLLANKWNSKYKDWFYVNFEGNTPYDDGLHYEPWEGHYSLVKLNLANWDVKNYLLDCARFWIREFDVDAFRLDVAYSLDKDFLRMLRRSCDELKPGFILISEMIHGNYRDCVNPEMTDSATNYELYKGFHSSFNDKNLFEIAHSLQRQFGSQDWCIYRNMPMMNFLDNHDVTRIASSLKDKSLLELLYALFFASPGIPSIYYGSEWGAQGHKDEYDDALRPYFEAPVYNELRDVVKGLISFWRNNGTMQQITYKPIFTNDYQMVIERSTEFETIWFVMNIYNESFKPGLTVDASRAVNLFSNKEIPLVPELELPAKCFGFIKL